MTTPIDVIKFITFYVLCVVYSFWIGLGIAVAYVFKRKSEFWKVKDRPNAPNALTSKEFVHNYAHVNVSLIINFTFYRNERESSKQVELARFSRASRCITLRKAIARSHSLFSYMDFPNFGTHGVTS